MATVTVQPEQPMPRVAGHLRTVSIPTRYAALAAVCLCAALTVFFSAYTADTAWSFPRFLIAAFVLIYVPGQCVLRRFGSELPQLENLLLSVILGMVTSSVIYAMCTATHVQPLFLAWPSVTSAALLWETRRRWDPWLHGQLQVSGAHLALALVLVATLAPLVINPRFLTNFDLDPEGVLQIRSQILDALLHLSVVHELSHSFPPSAQFLSGVPLAYHVGSDIVPALLIKMGGAHHLDVMFRYIPAVYLGLLILATFTAARRWLGSAYGGVLVAMLVALGEDFSFIPGILRMSTGYWSVQYFEAPSTFSFYTFNPMLLAVTVFFSALLTLQYWWTTRHASWFLITALLLALLIQLKIFLLPHIIVSLAAVGIVAFARWRDGRLLALVACTLAIAIPLYLVTLGQSESAERQLVRLFPFQYLDIMLREFGLGGSTIGTSVKSLYFDAEVTISTVLWTVGVALPVYLIGAFGWRMIGASLLLHSLWPTRETQLRAVAAVFVLTGAAVTLLFSVSAAGIPARETYNNAIWFIVASKHMAWLFAVEWIVARARASTMSGRYLLVLITLCLSLPSTIQTFWQFQHATQDDPGTIGPADLAMLRFLDQRCEHGETVMPQTIDARLGSWWVNPIVALTRCRIPISDIFAQSFISKGAYQQRDEDVVTMKSSLRNGTIPSDLFRTYQITLLHLECPSAPCLRIDDPAVSTLYRVEHPHIVVEVIEVRLP